MPISAFFFWRIWQNLNTGSYDVHIGFQQFIPAGRQHGVDVNIVCVYLLHTFLFVLKKNGWSCWWRELAGKRRMGDCL